MKGREEMKKPGLIITEMIFSVILAASVAAVAVLAIDIKTDKFGIDKFDPFVPSAYESEKNKDNEKEQESSAEESSEPESSVEEKKDDGIKTAELVSQPEKLDAQPKELIEKLEASSKVAQFVVSNPCFEVWFLLHYNLYTGAIHRNQYKDMLTKLTGIPYSKSEGYGAVMYNLLLSRQQQAINNAETVLAEISHGNPAEEESSTTVQRLVIELNKFL